VKNNSYFRFDCVINFQALIFKFWFKFTFFIKTFVLVSKNWKKYFKLLILGDVGLWPWRCGLDFAWP